MHNLNISESKPVIVSSIPLFGKTEQTYDKISLFKRISTPCYIFLDTSTSKFSHFKNSIVNYNLTYIDYESTQSSILHIKNMHNAIFNDQNISDEDIWKYRKLEFLYKTLQLEKDREYFFLLDYYLPFSLFKANAISDYFNWPKSIKSTLGKIAEFSGDDVFYNKFSSQKFDEENLGIHSSIFCIDRDSLRSMYLNIKSRLLDSLSKSSKFISFEKNLCTEISSEKYEKYISIIIDPSSKVGGQALFEDYMQN